MKGYIKETEFALKVKRHRATLREWRRRHLRSGEDWVYEDESGAVYWTDAAAEAYETGGKVNRNTARVLRLVPNRRQLVTDMGTVHVKDSGKFNVGMRIPFFLESDGRMICRGVPRTPTKF